MGWPFGVYWSLDGNGAGDIPWPEEYKAPEGGAGKACGKVNEGASNGCDIPSAEVVAERPTMPDGEKELRCE